MSTRIGLVTNPKFGRSVTKFVDVADLKQLVDILAKANAKRIALYWRDRIGDGHTEGEPFAVKDLSEKHFTWVSTQTKDATRALFYDTKE